MKYLILGGLATIALLPAFIILSLLIYKIYNDYKQKRFEKKGNIVLTREKIGKILKERSPSELLQIFKSAICDHASVNGIQYYTKFPFGSRLVNAHDDHRKAFIAHEIGEILTKTTILNGDLRFCTDTLLCLTDWIKEKYYTQLMAWNSLGKLARFQKDALIEQIHIDLMKECLSTDYISGMGIVKFIFTLRGYEDVDIALIDAMDDLIGYALEKGSYPIIAFLVFKLSKKPHLENTQKQYPMERIPDDPKLKNFIHFMGELSLGFTREEVIEGLKNLGLQPRPYSPKTTEGEIVRFLVQDFLEEIFVTSSYVLHSFNSDGPRQNLTDFLWI